MVIIFYDCASKSIFIASEQHPLKTIPIDTPNIGQHIPNDDILYVQAGAFYNKAQFVDILYDKVAEANTNQQIHADVTRPSEQDVEGPLKFYVHAIGNGTVVVNDITKLITDPSAYGGLKLEGKWHFVPLDDINKDELDNSQDFKTLLRFKKIEIVDSNYIKKHSGEMEQFKSQSAAERELNNILVPPEIKAMEAVSRFRKGIPVRENHHGTMAIPIDIK